MAHLPESTQKPRTFHEEHFPWRGIIGYLLSIVLTAFSLWIGLTHAAQFGYVLYVILGLAVLQIFVQMFMFMHVTESDEGFPWQTFGMISGLIFVAAIVLMSIWIMGFGAQVA